MRSATTKRSSGGFIAFMLGTVGTLVLVIAVLIVGGSKPAAFVPAATTTGGIAPAGGGGNEAPAPAGDNAINVVEKEYAIAMDKTTIKAGSITITAKNNGSLPHNIEVKELTKATDNIDPGKTGTLTVDLKAGTYTIICNIPGHEQLGMKMTLTVQ